MSLWAPRVRRKMLWVASPPRRTSPPATADDEEERGHSKLSISICLAVRITPTPWPRRAIRSCWSGAKLACGMLLLHRFPPRCIDAQLPKVRQRAASVT